MIMPQGRLWNARLLPFYYFALYLLAAVGVSELGRVLATLFAKNVERPVRAVLYLTPVVGVLGALMLLAMSLQIMPGGRILEDGSYAWGIGELSLTTRDRSYIDSWADWNFEGYEGLSSYAGGVEQYRKSYPEYHDIVTEMSRLGREKGCGRALWEHEDQHDRYGTPMALMLLPFWTDGCIGSMEGLYFEASATTPYHFLMQDELSWSPSNAQRDMPYGPGPPTAADFDRGVAHLQMTGVRYYMAINPGMQALADAHPDLHAVGASGPWKVYEVHDAPLVQGLTSRPAVLTGQPTTGKPWQDVSVCWWVNEPDWNVALTADGPDDWSRVSRTSEPPAGATPTQQCQPSADWGWFDGTGAPPTAPEDPVEVKNIDLRVGRHLVRRRPAGRARAGQGLVLPQLEGVRRPGPVPGGAQLHGRDPRRQPRRAELRLDGARPAGLRGHAGRPRRARVAVPGEARDDRAAGPVLGSVRAARPLPAGAAARDRRRRPAGRARLDHVVRRRSAGHRRPAPDAGPPDAGDTPVVGDPPVTAGNPPTGTGLAEPAGAVPFAPFPEPEAEGVDEGAP